MLARDKHSSLLDIIYSQKESVQNKNVKKLGRFSFYENLNAIHSCCPEILIN
jgi:hypothetical protein